MFNDEENKKGGSVPVNLPISEPVVNSSNQADATLVLPKEVAPVSKVEPVEKKITGAEDIFSGSGIDEKPAVFSAIDSEHNDDWGISEEELKAQNKKKLTMLLTILISIVLLGAVVYWGFAQILKMMDSSLTAVDGVDDQEQVETKSNNSLTDVAPVNNIQSTDVSNSGDAISSEGQSDEINPEAGLVDEGDNDRDGLTNQEEIELGTNLNKVDSDSDGLFDREEVKIYRTNPLNPDTDGDGFLDGEEVKAGYNPKGEGRLKVIK